MRGLVIYFSGSRSLGAFSTSSNLATLFLFVCLYVFFFFPSTPTTYINISSRQSVGWTEVLLCNTEIDT